MNIINNIPLYDGVVPEGIMNKVNDLLSGKGVVNWNEYQIWTHGVLKYPQSLAIFYCALGLNGEAGEVADKIKKIIRDDQGEISEDHIKALRYELGDVLWYIARLADELGISLWDVMKSNIQKIEDRKAMKKINGSGDTR